MALVRASEKFYDHAADAHLLDQMKRPERGGISLAVVGSKYLEHLNAPLKDTLKKLKGGGAPKDPHANKPVVQAKKKMYGWLKVKRMQRYAEYAQQDPGTAGQRGFLREHPGGDINAPVPKRPRTMPVGQGAPTTEARARPPRATLARNTRLVPPGALAALPSALPANFPRLPL